MYDSGPLKLTTVEQGEGIDLLSDDSCEPAANANANANQVVPSKDQSEEDSQKQRTQSRKRRHPSGESTSGSKHHLTADYMARTREASTSPGPNFRCQTPRMGSPSIRSPGPRNSYTSPSLSRESLRSLSPNMRSFSPLMCLKLRCNVSSPGIPAKHSKQMDKLSQEIWDQYMEQKQKKETFEKKIKLRESLYSFLRQHIPIDLYMVGSSLNGLGSDKSDVDMCLVLKNSPESINQMMHAIPILKYVKDLLSDLSFVRNPQLIIAKVPLLKFNDPESGIEVDLNLNNIIGIRNTQLLSCYRRMDWRVSPLVLTVKRWARENNINDAHNKTISSYSIVLMVIHYLQCGCDPPILPCLQKIMPNKFLPNSDIKILNLNEDLPSFKSTNQMSLAELFIGFLEYFGHYFDFDFNAISIRVGSAIPKSIVRDYRSSKNTPTQWKYLSIEEPFDRTNTARSVYDEEVFNHILDVFRRSFYRLKQTHNLFSVLY